MKPTTSFWDTFSREGRIKKLWAEALRETDREKSLVLLRTVRDKMCTSPALVHLWLPFLDTFLAEERVQFLKESDLTDVEEMGKFLQQTPNLQNAPSTFVLWQQLIEAYNTRRENMLACNLAAKIYHDKSADEQARAYCLRELARQGLIENRYLDMYIAHLRVKTDPQTETEIFQALNTLFTIDFSASDTRLESVNRVAQSLLSFNIPMLQTLTPQIWTAEGVYTLLVKAAPEDAKDYFKRAIRLNSGDRTASLGLLACEIRLGGNLEVTSIAQNPSFRNLLHDPDIAALFNLHKLIQWLNQPEMAGPLPLDASAVTHLATYPLHRYVGDIAEATLGRFYLLTGNARLARTHFDILVKKRLKLHNWGYYAAWAYALCGEHTGLVDCFRQLINWPGRWTIACMLLDLNPHLAEQSGATTLLKNIAATEVPIASVVKCRLAAAQTSLCTNSDAWTEALDSLEEALEALRTRLSATIMLKDRETATSLTSLPLFARLPLADQTFWLSLVEHDRARSLSLLQQAAGSWQYQRAALFLVVVSLHQGNWRQADRYLEQALAERTDLKAQLIRIYIESRDANIDESIQQCEQLAAQGEERAYYILGNLYFRKAAEQFHQRHQARLQAALAWQRFLATGQTVPEDLVVLAACASFIAYPQQRASSALALIENFHPLAVAHRQPWLEWHVALALLWYGTPQALIGAYTTLCNVAKMAEQADDATVVALVQALARFAYELKGRAATQQFLELLGRFAQQSQESVSKQTISSAIIMAQRSLYLNADKQQRLLIEKDLHHHLVRDPYDGLLVLWQACIALRMNKRQGGHNASTNYTI